MVGLAYMKATQRQPEIVVRKGKPVSVILPIEMYQELLERLEDAEDMAWLKQARQKPMRYRPLEEYLAQRKAKCRV
jgi:prevent-host-death family protein